MARAQFGPPGVASPFDGMERDRFGRPVRLGRDNDPLRRPMYPGAKTDIMGRPLPTGSDPFRQPLYPGATIDRHGRPLVQDRSAQPPKPGHRRGRSDEEEEKERCSGALPVPQFHPPLHLPLPSGGGTAVPAKFTSPEARWRASPGETSLKTSTPRSGGWPSGGSGGLLGGIGAGLAALFGAAFGRRKKRDEPSA